MSADELADDEGDETIEADPTEILDPADYNQNQRLKEIHRARKDVREALKATTSGPAPEKEHIATHRKLAEAVAFYGHELMPLMDEAGWSHEFERAPYDSVRYFINHLGASPEADWEYPPKSVSMSVFSYLNQFANEVGLGADLDDGGDEWEV